MEVTSSSEVDRDAFCDGFEHVRDRVCKARERVGQIVQIGQLAAEQSQPHQDQFE
jgi:hypothetical protein